MPAVPVGATLAAWSGKARTHHKLPWWGFAMSGIWAGAFIAFGGLLAVTASTGVTPVGAAKLLGAAVFPVGLVLVALAGIGGALFTGGVAVWVAALTRADGSAKQLSYAWAMMLLFNAVGSLAVVALVGLGGILDADTAVGAHMAATANAKVSHGWGEAVMRGIGCNILVCAAVWLAARAESTAGAIIALWWPITCFVACGFEHSVANMFLLPAGAWAGASEVTALTSIWGNIIPVTLGNIIGGAIWAGSAICIDNANAAAARCGLATAGGADELVTAAAAADTGAAAAKLPSHASNEHLVEAGEVQITDLDSQAGSAAGAHGGADSKPKAVSRAVVRSEDLADVTPSVA